MGQLVAKITLLLLQSRLIRCHASYPCTPLDWKTLRCTSLFLGPFKTYTRKGKGGHEGTRPVKIVAYFLI